MMKEVSLLPFIRWAKINFHSAIKKTYLFFFLKNENFMKMASLLRHGLIATIKRFLS